MKEFQITTLSDIERVRIYLLERLSFLLERQIRVSRFRENIEGLGSQFLSEAQTPPSLAGYLIRLKCTLSLLHERQKKQLEDAICDLREVIPHVNHIIVGLATVMKELEYFSTHDPLTGLHNRLYFGEMLEHEISRSSRYHHAFSILMLDIDDFKSINDSYGHPCGDIVLKSLAKVMNSNIRKGDITARIGGDEFSIILMETDQKGGKRAAEKLRQLIDQLSLEDRTGRRFHATVSIGVVSYPKNAKKAWELMTWVDVCLYRAKAGGKNRVYVLSERDQTAENKPEIILSYHLREALHESRIVPFFQPILDCHSGQIFAYEMVARLLEPDGEPIPAATFMGGIEKYGLGHAFHQAIILKALEVYKEKVGQRKEPPLLFINLAVPEIEDHSILDHTKNLCHQFGIPHFKIVFEILEREVAKSKKKVEHFLVQGRKEGFAFAVDNFGISYDTFHHLHEFSFEYVKIDGSFIRNILASGVDRSFVQNIYQLCQEFGFLTIAECVESEEILQEIKKIGIPYAQGFHIGTPQPDMNVVTGAAFKVQARRT